MIIAPSALSPADSMKPMVCPNAVAKRKPCGNTILESFAVQTPPVSEPNTTPGFSTCAPVLGANPGRKPGRRCKITLTGNNRRELNVLGTRKEHIDLALKFWRLTHWAKRVGHLTPFRQVASVVASEKNFQGSFIPVDEEIEVPPNVVAPRKILEDYITRASHRTIAFGCACRSGEGCERYPRDLGCIFLGEGGRDIDPGVGREASVEEALDHMERAIGLGLLPMIGHIRIDQAVFGIRDYSRFLTVCFCCECCCVIRSGMGNLVSAFPRSMVRLEGIEVSVGDGCVGCGECVPVCPVANMSIVDGRATVGEMCLGCGTCARNCSRGNIEITIREGSRMDSDIRLRIESGVEI